MATEEKENRPGVISRFFKFIFRVVLATLILTPLALILVVLGQYGLDLGTTELERSNQALNSRFTVQDDRVDNVYDEIGGLMAANQDQDDLLRDLREQSSSLNLRVDSLGDKLELDMERQESMLTNLETQVTGLVDQDKETATTVSTLNNAVTALQTDINTSMTQMDSIGGELDALTGQMSTLEGDLTSSFETFEVSTSETIDTQLASVREEMAVPQEELVETIRALRYFRVWELVTRSRLRLADGDEEAAAADIKSAVDSIAVLKANDENMVDALTPIENRLNLAAGFLPGEPANATSDLELAWNALDSLVENSLNSAEVMSGLAMPVAETTELEEPAEEADAAAEDGEAVEEDAAAEDEEAAEPEEEADDAEAEDADDADSDDAADEDDAEDAEDGDAEAESDNEDADAAEESADAEGSEEEEATDEEAEAVAYSACTGLVIEDATAVVGSAVVNTVPGRNLNARPAPSTKVGILFKLAHQTEISLAEGQCEDEDGRVWQRISVEGTEAWVALEFLNVADS